MGSGVSERTKYELQHARVHEEDETKSHATDNCATKIKKSTKVKKKTYKLPNFRSLGYSIDELLLHLFNAVNKLGPSDVTRKRMRPVVSRGSALKQKIACRGHEVVLVWRRYAATA